MLKKMRISFLLLWGAVLVLSACGSQTPVEPTQTQPNPEAVYTSAAQTADARMTEAAGITPSATQARPTDTLAPPSDTPIPGTPTQTSPPSPEGGGLDLMEFVVDVTVPDGANYAPGDNFTKTWRLRNIGTSTWTAEYDLVFVSGAKMGALDAVPLQQNVPPNEMVDVSVDLTAPADTGEYYGYWMLRNAGGRNFGIGANVDAPFYVMINVVPSAATAGAATPTTGTGTPAATGTAESQRTVANVSISVDEASVEAACPHTFNFNTKFTLNEAATVTYRLEAETNFDITLPAPITVQLDAGDHEVNYTLEFTDSVSGWAQLHVTAPEDVASDRVNFELTCQ